MTRGVGCHWYCPPRTLRYCHGRFHPRLPDPSRAPPRCRRCAAAPKLPPPEADPIRERSARAVAGSRLRILRPSLTGVMTARAPLSAACSDRAPKPWFNHHRARAGRPRCPSALIVTVRICREEPDPTRVWRHGPGLGLLEKGLSRRLDDLRCDASAPDESPACPRGAARGRRRDPMRG